MLPSEITDIIHSYAEEKCYNCGDYVNTFYLGLTPYLTMWYDNIRHCYIPNVFLCGDCKIIFKKHGYYFIFQNTVYSWQEVAQNSHLGNKVCSTSAYV